jgi:hypothetical protein
VWPKELTQGAQGHEPPVLDNWDVMPKDKDLLEPEWAVELLRRQLATAPENLPFYDPQVLTWWNTTTNIIREAFSPDHPNVDEFFKTAVNSGTPYQQQRQHEKRFPVRKALLMAFIDQLESMSPTKPPAAVSVDREGVYFAGQQFDAMLHVSKLLSAATKSIVVIDGYISADILALLTAKAPSVTVYILTKPLLPALVPIANAFNHQYGRLSIRSSSAFHDRFIIIDDTDFYHFGASIKDLGKRGFMFSRIEEQEVIDSVRKKLSQEWAVAKIEV